LVDDSDNRGGQGILWTLQQFWTGPTGKPWYALQKQTDEGVIWQYTGYRHEVEAICRRVNPPIVPQELPPTTEEEFLRRAMGKMPEEPATRPTGRMTWEPM